MQAVVLLGIVTLVVGLGGALALDAIGFGEGSVPMMALDIILPAILIIVLFRLITNLLITHFGETDGHTHGSARVASDKEVAPLTRSSSGLLIGRDGKTKKLLRYDGPAHLLTMAPTRTGKGVGIIIPNLLNADRSVICIDPKGENARIARRPRDRFGPVYVLDPFGVAGQPSAAFKSLLSRKLVRKPTDGKPRSLAVQD